MFTSSDRPAEYGVGQGSKTQAVLARRSGAGGAALSSPFLQWLGTRARRVSVASGARPHPARDESVVPSLAASARNCCCLIAGGSGVYKKAAPSPEFLEAFSRKLAGLFHLRFQHHPVVAFASTSSHLRRHFHLHLHLHFSPSPHLLVSSASDVRSAQIHSFIQLV